MPLNYSKWDQLEVRLFQRYTRKYRLSNSLLRFRYPMIRISKDIPMSTTNRLSGVQGLLHILSDLIYIFRWRQRDIHEKREARKHKIAQLQANIDCDHVLLPRITDIANKLADPSIDTVPYYNAQVEKLEKEPSKDCPPGNDSSKSEQTYDGMLLILLRGITEVVKKRIQESNVAEPEKQTQLARELASEMNMHVKQLAKSIDDKKRELEEEISEQKKKITSDDIHEGFVNKVLYFSCSPIITDSD